VHFIVAIQDDDIPFIKTRFGKSFHNPQQRNNNNAASTQKIGLHGKHALKKIKNQQQPKTDIQYPGNLNSLQNFAPPCRSPSALETPAAKTPSFSTAAITCVLSSFASRTSRPRLWQYHRTSSTTRKR
jgi:hypothetical protein